MTAIVCPSCKDSESFALIREIRVVTDLDRNGEPTGGNEFANETNRQWLSCSGCGHAWRTRRWFSIEIDVR